jgi:hypothetical protein
MRLTLNKLLVDKTVIVKPKKTSTDSGHVAAEGYNQQLLSIDVKGRVVNEKGEAVIATVSVKGTEQATRG